MNKVFAEHVTNTAFFLSVSKKQVRYIEILYKTPFPDQGYYYRDNIFLGGRSDPDNWAASYSALCRKGLVTRVVHDPIREYSHYELTRAGELLCEMLVEAGMISGKNKEELAA